MQNRSALASLLTGPVALFLAVALGAGALWLHVRVHRRFGSYFVFLAALVARLAPGFADKVVRRRHLRPSAWEKTAVSAGEQRVWGYVDRHSIAPGGRFDLMLRRPPGSEPIEGSVEILRVGHHASGDRLLVYRSSQLRIAEHEVIRAGAPLGFLDKTAAASGPNWPPTLAVEGTGEWRSGYYSIDFVAADGTRDEDVAFIVVTDGRRHGDVLVKLATSSYQAYNTWGGHGLYDEETRVPPPANPRDAPQILRGHLVSFDRPTRSEFWEWEYYLVLWLERLAEEEGFSVSYATNFDVATQPEYSSSYRLFVVAGHDEYWTGQEFEQMRDRLFRQGGNTLFLGANLAYWQVRFADIDAREDPRGRQLVCYKSIVDPFARRGADAPELHMTARFRDLARLPETMLMGVAYQSNFAWRGQEEPRYAYFVEDPGLPFFAGTGYQKGDFVAEILGHEWDNRDPEAAYAPPGEKLVEGADRLWDAARSRIDPLPLDRIRVVFSGRVVDVYGREGKAEAVYFETPAGARVFSAGTIRWSWGLGKPGYRQEPFQVLNRNLFSTFLQ